MRVFRDRDNSLLDNVGSHIGMNLYSYLNIFKTMNVFIKQSAKKL